MGGCVDGGLVGGDSRGPLLLFYVLGWGSGWGGAEGRTLTMSISGQSSRTRHNAIHKQIGDEYRLPHSLCSVCYNSLERKKGDIQLIDAVAISDTTRGSRKSCAALTRALHLSALDSLRTPVSSERCRVRVSAGNRGRKLTVHVLSFNPQTATEGVRD